MTQLTDMHIHALYGVDDGAQSAEEMVAIVESAYKAGVRIMCLTPHYHPGYYGNNRAKADNAFEELCAVRDKKFLGLKLFLGNELHYDLGAYNWISEGQCLTLANTRYILVDFDFEESADNITNGIYQILNMGYVPVLAHAERYYSFRGKIDVIEDFKNKGVKIQMDSGSPLGEFGGRVKRFSRRLLNNLLVDIVSSDAHDTTKRVWNMDKCYSFLKSKYGRSTAEKLCNTNAKSLLCGGNNR